jgi:uncharacterized radical SAM superfamily Fe-S cluster-containing enzyme
MKLSFHPKKDKTRFRIEKIEQNKLPYLTKSICPDCLFLDKRVNVIPAEISEESGYVVMKKTCQKHGFFKETIWGDIQLWVRMNSIFYKSIGIDNPRNNEKFGCPLDCGLCENHCSHTALGLVDVTLRCNLKCPICFADSNNTCEDPSTDEVLNLLRQLRKNVPVPTPGIQFAGGEPTICENLPLYIGYAKELGFNHIMVATNGIKFAEDPNYIKHLVKQGLNTAYLQFDGVTERPYLQARGTDLREIKYKAIVNCRKSGLDGIILVPTIVGGLNDNELGDIINFALLNKDIIRCINFQPVSFIGRIDHHNREKMRITIPEVINKIHQQTDGLIRPEDWYPISSMLPLGRAIGLLNNEPYLELSANPQCGAATFLVFDSKGKPYAINRILKMNKFIEALENVCDMYTKEKHFGKIRARMKIGYKLWQIKEKWIVKNLIKELFKKGDYDSLVGFMSNVIMIGMMHFMDPYNLDLERVKYCDIHYSTSQGLIPFCTQNTVHRFLNFNN